jgi:hypothetical protein
MKHKGVGRVRCAQRKLCDSNYEGAAVAVRTSIRAKVKVKRFFTKDKEGKP